MISRDKIRGMFLGVAIGDALGMPVETFSREKIASTHGRITNYLRPDGHKWFNGRAAGTWTDDTQLTLVVAESLIRCRGIDVEDLARCHLEHWEREGDLGFGGTTRAALKKLKDGMHWSQSGVTTNPKHGRGNALPMKISPIGAYWYLRKTDFNENWQTFVEDLARCTFMTHETRMALESAIAHVCAIEYCLGIKDTKRFFHEEFLWYLFSKTMLAYNEEFSPTETPCPDRMYDRLGLLLNTPLHTINTSDLLAMFGENPFYVYSSLPLTYALFLKNPTSIESIYDIVNAGGDTDTNASIAGGLLGALNGVSVFPKTLVENLWQKERVLDTANQFCDVFHID